jgi:AraC-like DNA-binding protein
MPTRHARPAQSRDAPTVSSQWTRLIAKVADSAGVPARELFDTIGMDYGLLDDPDARFEQDHLTQFWTELVRRTGDEQLPMRAVRLVSPSAYHFIGYLMMSSATLRDCLEKRVRYDWLVAGSARTHLRDEADGVAIVCAIFGERLPVVRQSYELACVCIVEMVRWLLQRRVVPLYARFTHAGPADPQPMRDYVGCPISYGHAENALCFSLADTSTALPTADREIARFHESLITDYIANAPRPSFLRDVRRYLREHLPDGMPRQGDVAEHFHMSESSFYRHLAEQGARYADVLDDVRRELAQYHLKQSRLSVLEIALLVGYAEPSAFFRACKKWFGVSPKEYRAGMVRSLGS